MAPDDDIDPNARHADFARRLVAGMRKWGLTDAVVMEECDYSDEFVRLLRRGKRMPGDEGMRKLVIKPIQISFLQSGYRKVPDNSYGLALEVKKIAFEKGYTYQSIEEVAKEAAIRMGMTR